MRDRCPAGHEYSIRCATDTRECRVCVTRNQHARRRRIDATAIRYALPWEPWEVELALGSNHSVPTVALAIGRTLQAVEAYRRRATRRAA